VAVPVAVCHWINNEQAMQSVRIFFAIFALVKISGETTVNAVAATDSLSSIM